LVEQYKAAFSSMVQTEKEQFVEQSYFVARGQEEAGEEEGKAGEAEESDSSAVSLNSESEDDMAKLAPAPPNNLTKLKHTTPCTIPNLEGLTRNHHALLQRL